MHWKAASDSHDDGSFARQLSRAATNNWGSAWSLSQAQGDNSDEEEARGFSDAITEDDSSSSEDRLNDPGCASAFCREPDQGDLVWEQVVLEERDLIKRKKAHLMPSRNQAPQAPFDVAFSGGGVRAAAFQAGVLWRLAQAGKLQNVEHFVAVSGGAYVASAFASTLTGEEPKPQDRTEVSSFYLRCAAKTVCRMQRNVGYLVRDLRLGHLWNVADDGSSRVPPIFDVPILLAVMLFSMIVNPLTAFTLYILPFVEGVDLFEGSAMKAAYCAPNWTVAITIFSIWGPACRSMQLLLFSILLGFALRLVSVFPMCRVRKRKDGEVPQIARVMMSLRAVVVRASVVQMVIMALVTGAFIVVLDRTSVRVEKCAPYIRARTVFQDGGVSFNTSCRDMYHGLPWWTASYYDSYFTPPELDIMNASIPKLHSWRRHVLLEEIQNRQLRTSQWLVSINQLLVAFQHEILGRLSTGIGEASLASMLALTLFAALVLNPFVNGIFFRVLSLLGPVMAMLIAGAIVQHRIFASITKESYVAGWFPWPPQETWREFALGMFGCAILIVLFYHHLHSVSHTFYARSLRKAYFYDGKDQTWSDVRDNPYCPLFLFTGTVTDFRRPGEDIPITEISMSPLHTGSGKTGFVPTPDWRSLAKSAALAAAASDGFIIGMLDRARYRFWLEFLNLRMGDYILFERRPLKLVAKINRWRSVSDKPFFLYGAIPLILQTFAVVAAMCSFLISFDSSACDQAETWYWVWAGILTTSLTLSFFAGNGMLEIFLHSPAIRHLHMALRYYHVSEKAPTLIYVTDGGVQDCTGLYQLLIRRSARILLALASSDPDDELSVLRETMQLAVSQALASFYDPRDPRRDPSFVLDDFKHDPEQRHFVLGIRYPPQARGPEYGAKLTGRLVVVKNRLPKSMQAYLPEPLLTEEEIFINRERMPNPLSPRWKDSGMKQADLAGCCCDCCHVNMCNVGPKFPHVSNANQCLTPALFSALCRLGFRLSADAVDLIALDSLLEEPWEAAIPRWHSGSLACDRA